MIKTILFDLDGTLLPMDQEVFTKAYFSRIAENAMPRGYQPEQLIQGIWKGTKAMVTNDGSLTNETAFWNTFAQTFGEEALKDKALFDEFYANEFELVKESCGFQPLSRAVIETCKEKGLRVILATNPIFPRIATEKRVRWAGLEPDMFEWITTYESCHYGKPNPVYYQEICTVRDLDPSECMMVGNDVVEDMSATSIGMKGYVVTDCLINKMDEDLSKYPHGSMEELHRFLQSLSTNETK